MTLSLRPSDHLRLECCPLHTEKPVWEAHAPRQIDAAMRRGADVIGFSELGPIHKDLRVEVERLAAQHGYVFYGDRTDAALVYKKSLADARTSTEHIAGRRARARLSFRFHSRTVTVFVDHWETTSFDKDGSVRREQTKTMIRDLQQASLGSDVSFFLADSNPSAPLRDRSGEPQRSLRNGGVVTVYDELDRFPAAVGVTTIGRPTKDRSVSAVSAVLHSALGSDHHPVLATYRVRRRLFHR